jgi:prepilin-type N-terminal cleavage/methylation domain-containing protein
MSSSRRAETGRERGNSRKRQSGFTMLEMVVSMVVLMIGLLSLAQVLGYALSVTNRGRTVTNTKLLVVSMLEQMENLRNTGQLTYGQIANAGSVDNTGATFNFAGFPGGLKKVSKDPGPDGIYGTGDDLTSAGKDGILGNGDDKLNDDTLARPGFLREIVITPLGPNLKRIAITLEYTDSEGHKRTIEGKSYLNNDARANVLR